MLRKIRIVYEGGNGSFEYVSDQLDLYVAISVATKEMFKQCIWLQPSACRISEVTVTWQEFDPGEKPDTEYEGTGDSSL